MQSRERGKMRMTLDELKVGAKMHEYKLIIRHNPNPKLLRCTCGSNRRGWWATSANTGKSEDLLWQLECKKCGKRSEWADSERGVIEKWNEMIESEMNNG